MRILPTLALLPLIAACTQRVEPPTATIALQTEGPFSTAAAIILDGSGSSDSGENAELGLGLEYNWHFVSTPPGSQAWIDGAGQTVSAFMPDLYGEYNIGLVVSNGLLTSPEAIQLVTVDPCGNEAPVVAEVSTEPATPITGERIQLAASVSDEDNAACGLGQVVSRHWQLVDAPTGSQAQLVGADGTAPWLVGDVPGIYTVSLVVTDDTGRSNDPFLHVIVVSDCGDATPTVDDIIVSPDTPSADELVSLAVTVSDVDNDETGVCGADLGQVLDTRSWFVDRPAGSAAVLSPDEGLAPAFVPDVIGSYIVRTEVSDDTGRSSFVDTTVTADACGISAPIVDSVTPSSTAPNTGDEVSFAVVVSDPDNDATGVCGNDLGQLLAIRTEFLARPVGSAAAFAPWEGPTPAFVADLPGEYTVRTWVTDDTGRTGFSDTDISAGVCGNAAPTVSISDPGAGGVEQELQLTAVVRDADTKGFVDLSGDQDSDGLSGAQEVVAGTDPLDADSDNDGLMDGDEVNLWLTDPGAVDSDGGGVDDGIERLVQGTDANNASDDVEDTTDTDADGLSDDREGLYGTDPALDDSDSDGVLDGAEIDTHETDPLAADTDGDGIDDGDEIAAGTDPLDDGAPVCALDQPVSYWWSIVAQPVASVAALNNPASADPTLTPDVSGTYTLQLVVTDSTGRASSPTFRDIDVSACGEAPPTVAIDDPGSSFGVIDTVDLTATVGDPDDACGADTTRVWQWSIVSAPTGSAAVLYNPTTMTPVLDPDLPGDYTVELTVTDALGLWTTDSFTIVGVGTCGINVPVVDAADPTPAAPNTWEPVSFAVSVSDADVDSCGLTQVLDSWSEFVSRPAGSTASLAPAEGIEPAFVPDVPGDFVVRTWVTDDTGLSSFIDTTVTSDLCGSQTPDAQLEMLSPYADGPGASVTPPVMDLGVDVWLDAVASSDPDYDPTGCALTGPLYYDWFFTALPIGSGATFNDSSLVRPSFTPDVPGFYEITLRVSDGVNEDFAFMTVEATPTAFINVPSGFSIDFVDGFGGLWNNPEGVTVDNNGDIFVVQNGSDTITVTSPSGATSYFSAGGFLQDIRDIVYYPDGDEFFVSSDNIGEIIRVQPSGFHEEWSNCGDAPRGLSIWTDGGGTDRLIVAERGRDRIEFYDPTDGVGACRTGSTDYGGRVDRPWGVAGRPNNNQLFYTNDGNDRMYRHNSDVRQFDNLNGPREVLYSPSGRIIIADPGNGTVWSVQNCGSQTCPAFPLAVGPWEPWGLAIESNNELLVTDRRGNALFRITGSF